MRATHITGSILFAILLLTSVSVVSATTYLGVSDSNLVDQADAVALDPEPPSLPFAIYLKPIGCRTRPVWTPAMSWEPGV
ncbi:MAG TPA: hypothetical protein VGS07_23845 [Thermoanaerobaculia bacterium]|jgi:hypothetical protein|nr:hypothetical protein [Thermoanaerobaculia bacterium]